LAAAPEGFRENFRVLMMVRWFLMMVRWLFDREGMVTPVSLLFRQRVSREFSQ
jgi:hypothetical protein